MLFLIPGALCWLNAAEHEEDTIDIRALGPGATNSVNYNWVDGMIVASNDFVVRYKGAVLTAHRGWLDLNNISKHLPVPAPRKTVCVSFVLEAAPPSPILTLMPPFTAVQMPTISYFSIPSLQPAPRAITYSDREPFLTRQAIPIRFPGH